MSKKFVLISDPSLRDGNHAVHHQISAEQIAEYCKLADAAGIPIVEVGHGNGIGASSLQLGESNTIDAVALEVARNNLKSAKLGIHFIPGFATIERDMKLAIDIGVDIIRVASHCSEADITKRHIIHARDAGKTVYGVLMMSHMLDANGLLEQAKKMEEYGAQSVIFMDSAGVYLPTDIKDRVSILVDELSIPVGFHAHNNLAMGVANSIMAVESGADILDGSIRGFGAGAGNAQLEALIAVLHKMGYTTGIDLYKLLDAADWAEKHLLNEVPIIRSTSIISGLSGVFSGFLKPVQRIAKEYSIDPRDVFFELGKRKIVAGQEDMILEVVLDLSERGLKDA